jgi:glycosyltransferase involved in cell wall biosynthesis
MKLGFLIYDSLDTLSGGYLYDRKLVEYLRGQGDTVEIISLPWRNYAAHLTDNFRFRLPPGLDLLIQDELKHPSLLSANAHPHPYPMISLVHHLRCSEQRPPWGSWFYRLIEKRYLESVDGFIFNSQTTSDVVNGLIEAGKPHMVAYPPTDRFGQGLSKSEILARANEPGPLRILFLGNIIRRKGLHVLLEAISDQPLALSSRTGVLTARAPSTRGTRTVSEVEGSAFSLDVVGGLTAEPEYASAMQKKSQVSSLKSTVHFCGPLDDEPLIEKLKFAQVLVVPSSYEGLGIVYLEGMAFGLPAIGTTAGGASEIIGDGETGFLIPPDDAETLAERLSMLANDRDLLTRLSVKALERYRQQPRWDETAGKIRGFLHVIARSVTTKQSPNKQEIATPPEGGSQ